MLKKIAVPLYLKPILQLAAKFNLISVNAHVNVLVVIQRAHQMLSDIPYYFNAQSF